MKLQQKPKGKSRLVIVFDCEECGRENTAYENYVEWEDWGDGDSLDYSCECGNYYKKLHHIEEEHRKEVYFEKIK